MLALSPKRITELRGIDFQITKDALDYCKAALLVTPDGQQFALRSYYRGRHPDKTELIGNERSLHPEVDVESFLTALAIPRKHVAWAIGNRNEN